MDKSALISTCHNYYINLPQRQKTIVILLALLVGLLTLIILTKCCLAIASAKPKTITPPLLIRETNQITIPQNSPLRTQMTIQAVSTSDAPHIVTLPGVVEADAARTVNVLPPLAGHLIDLKVQLGDEVKRDQVLALIKSPGLAQASADELKARGTLKQAEEALHRAQKVNRAGGNSIKDIQLAQSNFIQAKAEAQRAKATLKSLGNNKSSVLRIQSPIDGKITSLNYGIGSYINDPSTPIMTINNINSVWVTVSVPENLIALVKKGQKVNVTLTAYPKQHWQGKVSFVNNLIDPDTRTNKTRIAFTNPDGKLQPNMFAKITIELPQQAQVTIPITAILMNNDTTTVYIETAPWTFKQHSVVLGAEDGNSIRIKSGLKAGDHIIASGGILVND